MSNHLGNINVVISDKRKSFCDEELGVERFEAEVLSAVDYYPFGKMLPDRQYYASNDTGLYKFTFNGKLLDRETGFQDYGFRIYYPDLGKFLSVDPLTKEYPWNSTYAFAENRVIDGIDLEGKEYYPYHAIKLSELATKTAITIYSHDYVIVKSLEFNVKIGVGPGLAAIISRGEASDKYGITTFKASTVGYVSPKNQDVVWGPELTASGNVLIDNSVSSFDDFAKKKPGVTFNAASFAAGSFTIGEDRIGLSGGIGWGASISQIETKVTESISVSYEENYNYLDPFVRNAPNVRDNFSHYTIVTEGEGSSLKHILAAETNDGKIFKTSIEMIKVDENKNQFESKSYNSKKENEKNSNK